MVYVTVSSCVAGVLAAGVGTSAIATVPSTMASTRINVRILLIFFTVILLLGRRPVCYR